MDEWQKLISNSVIGTSRQQFQLSRLTSTLHNAQLKQFLQGLEKLDGEHQILAAAAALSLYQKIGHSPAQTNEPLPIPCADDELPVCNQKVANYFARIQGEYIQLLPQFLAAIRLANKAAPYQILPDLLTLGQKNIHLREDIIAILGTRGRWLAKLNSDWQYINEYYLAIDINNLTLWQTGNRNERIAFLKQLRSQDAQQARELLISGWSQETPEDRVKFVELFKEQLSMDDEPFLESLLDDKRKEVRRIATDLLAQLPESRFQQRMRARVLPLISLKVEKKKSVLELKLPAECDKEMLRDGIEAKKAQGKMGEKTWWLLQMISLLPPATIAQALNISVTELLTIIKQSEWKEMLINAWLMASERYYDEEWLEAMLYHELSVPKIIQLIKPERAEAVLIDQLLNVQERIPANLIDILKVHTHNWSERLSLLFLNCLRTHIEIPSMVSHIDGHVRNALKVFGLVMPPELYIKADQNRPLNAQTWSLWQSVVDELVSLLQFRYELLKEINA